MQPVYLIAFIDDDEQASPDGLENLGSVQQGTDADVVWGEVETFYAPNFPTYLSEIFGKGASHFSEKQVIEAAATNSTLYRTSLFNLRKPPFDPTYSGTEDYEFSALIFTNGIAERYSR